ncbi:MAG: hypothetical protein Q9162_005854 [Coniocarpon cinnabarinum]
MLKRALDKCKPQKATPHPEPHFEVWFDFEDGLSRVTFKVEAPPGAEVPPTGWKEVIQQLMTHYNIQDGESKTKGRWYIVKARMNDRKRKDELMAELDKAGMTKHPNDREGLARVGKGDQVRVNLVMQLSGKK